MTFHMQSGNLWCFPHPRTLKSRVEGAFERHALRHAEWQMRKSRSQILTGKTPETLKGDPETRRSSIPHQTPFAHSHCSVRRIISPLAGSVSS
ncbi:hypothetical protein AVEN_270288-1 [Araneus ventricosus]|uniref:Uncharacterized protein n=1 Tax=Araneus ventricosus TaxID=182803 RepID=A0A4Y2PJZ8_ARAVE|nr:hypothetical protein AVEN_270288-1 [Araneus ventricosus]